MCDPMSLLQLKQPLTVQPVFQRRLKEYGSIFEFQEDYPSLVGRLLFLKTLRNYEIDELIGLCNNNCGRIFYDSHKNPEKIFEYCIRPALAPFGRGTRVMVHDGPQGEKYAEFSMEGYPGTPKRVNLRRQDIEAIQAAMEDNLLFETDQLENSPKGMVLDGYLQYFFFALKGRENEFCESNLIYCKDDYENCIHAAHVIQTLEEIRDMLVPKGVPEKCFVLRTE